MIATVSEDVLLIATNVDVHNLLALEVLTSTASAGIKRGNGGRTLVSLVMVMAVIIVGLSTRSSAKREIERSIVPARRSF